jgi:Icc-related predicted phosphoesterase
MGLFRRKQPDRVSGGKQIKVLSTSDLHASDVVFKKFLNAGKMFKVDVMIIGGDLAGKVLIPIVDLGEGKYEINGEVVGREGLQVITQRIRNEGNYYVITDKKGYEELVNDKR